MRQSLVCMWLLIIAHPIKCISTSDKSWTRRQASKPKSCRHPLKSNNMAEGEIRRTNSILKGKRRHIGRVFESKFVVSAQPLFFLGL